MATALGCTGVAVLGIAGWRQIDPFGFFPGNPPVADIIVELGLLLWTATGLGLLASFGIGRRLGQPASLRRAAAFALGISLVTSTPAIIQVMHRQFGEWAELRAVLKETELGARMVAGRRGGRLSEREVEIARTWSRVHPVQFTFRGLRDPVQIRVMTPLPPYVGVDFGRGQNAVFDPTTMLSQYAD